MEYNTGMIVKNLLILTSLSLIVACDWVDSHGRDSNNAPVVEINFMNGGRTEAAALNEESSLRFSVSATDADEDGVSRYQWLTEPVEQGALNQCAGVTDFEMDLAANSLEEACSGESDCVISFEEVQRSEDSDDVEFQINAPELRAPIGLTYQLNAIDNAGGTGSQQSTFCLIAINEAPEAFDDVFDVLEGDDLTVSPAEGHRHLLTNDEQDDHVGNFELSVDTTPVIAPTLSTSFSLGTDGGFTYVAPQLDDRNSAGVVDTFVYSVTDGTHVSTATVTVNVRPTNDSPQQLANVPLQEIVVGVEFENDLSTYFTDPEGSDLSFSVTRGPLPASGSLTLSNEGVLSGTAGTVDEGTYFIEINAFDGSEQTKAEVEIRVVPNQPVQPGVIPIQQNELGEELELDFSEFFTDRERVPLTYSMANPYPEATIDLDENTGELVAVFSQVRVYDFEIVASDSVTAPVGIRFLVDVSSDNAAPEFIGPIANINVRVGSAIRVIRSAQFFSDEDDDELTYTVEGILPEGVSMSVAGVLSGRPSEEDTFFPITIVATDPLGQSATSNAFRIQVFPSLIGSNIAPETNNSASSN